MSVQYDMQGLLIYLSMALHLLAGGLLFAGRRRAGWGTFAAAFVAAVAAVVYRGFIVGHAPMRNLYEVFLLVGALMLPLSAVAGRLGVRYAWADAWIAAVALFPAGFVFDPQPRPLPPALQSPLFIPHVLTYMIGYAAMAKAAVVAAMVLGKGASAPPDSPLPRDRAVDRVARIGFVFITAGLLLGSLWGHRAWGDFWNWDPKELWSLASWLVLLAYFHARAMWGATHARLRAGLIIAAFLLCVVTLLWVNLSSLLPGLHSYAT